MSFTDPAVRCKDCQRIATREEIKQYGCCPQCGNRRVGNILIMSVEEKVMLEKNGFHNFLKLFEEVD